MTDNRNPSTTKRGPGRKHLQGHKRATPIAAKGAPAGFVQHTNPAKNARRKAKAASGARQYLRAVKAARRMAADAGWL